MMTSAELAPVVLLSLIGQECTVARQSYLDSVVVGFGPTHVLAWPLVDVRVGTWSLFSEAARWQVLDDRGTSVASARRSDHDLELALLRRRVVDVNAHEPSSLVVTFDSGARLEIAGSEEQDAGGESLWELRGPHGLALTAQNEDFDLVIDRSPAFTPGSPAALHDVLRRVAAELGVGLIETSSRDHGADAVLVDRHGGTIFVEIKRSAGGRARLLRFGRDFEAPGERIETPVDEHLFERALRELIQPSRA